MENRWENTYRSRDAGLLTRTWASERLLHKQDYTSMDDDPIKMHPWGSLYSVHAATQERISTPLATVY